MADVDKVNNPAHYGGKDSPYEHIKVMEATLTSDEFVGAMKFNISKYLTRHRQKNGLEDLRKAQWYMNRLVDYTERQEMLHPDDDRAGPPTPRMNRVPDPSDSVRYMTSG